MWADSMCQTKLLLRNVWLGTRTEVPFDRLVPRTSRKTSRTMITNVQCQQREVEEESKGQ